MATILRLAIDPLVGNRLPFVTYYLAVTAVAATAGLGAALFAVLASAALGTYFFTEALSAFAAGNLPDRLSIALFVLTSALVAVMTARLVEMRRRRTIRRSSSNASGRGCRRSSPAFPGSCGKRGASPTRRASTSTTSAFTCATCSATAPRSGRRRRTSGCRSWRLRHRRRRWRPHRSGGLRPSPPGRPALPRSAHGRARLAAASEHYRTLLRDRRTLVVGELPRDAVVRAGDIVGRELVEQFRSRSGVLCPLVSRGRVFGTLALGRSSGVPYAEADVKLVEAIATRAARLLENARLLETVRREADRRSGRVTKPKKPDASRTSSWPRCPTSCARRSTPSWDGRTCCRTRS